MDEEKWNCEIDGHEFKYEKAERDWICLHCGEFAPLNFYDKD